MKTRVRLFLVLFIVIFIAGMARIVVAVQTRPSEKQEKIKLIYADQLSGDVIDGKNVRKLVGHVKFRQGASILTCDRATEYVDEGHVLLLGRVRMVDSTRELLADKVHYFEETRKAVAEGRVVFSDSSKIMKANELEYDEINEIVTAVRNVTLSDTAKHMTLYGDSIKYHRHEGYALAHGHPKFVKLDSTESRTLTITGNVMEMFDDGERVKVSGDVVITRGEVVAHCGELEFINNEEKVILSITPEAQRESDFLKGKNIELFLQDNEVKAIKVSNNAIVTSQVDTVKDPRQRYDLLTGENILVSLHDEQIDTVVIKGRATSYYHLFEDGQEKGINKVLGDEIRMFFTDGNLKRVVVKSDPSTSTGTFYPPHNQSLIEGELRGILTQIGILSESSDSTSISSTQ